MFNPTYDHHFLQTPTEPKNLRHQVSQILHHLLLSQLLLWGARQTKIYLRLVACRDLVLATEGTRAEQ